MTNIFLLNIFLFQASATMFLFGLYKLKAKEYDLDDKCDKLVEARNKYIDRKEELEAFDNELKEIVEIQKREIEILKSNFEGNFYE